MSQSYIISPGRMRILADCDTIVIQSGYTIIPGDKLVIADCEILVVACEYTWDYGQFHWLASVTGDDVPALREMLTLRTEGEPKPEPPKLPGEWYDDP